jgi:GTP cyclohydrolase II/3,4-dihydroxy 2-butanone 4-phosphate synthase/GTP cyclohydrolase II
LGNEPARALLKAVPTNDSLVELYAEAPVPTRRGTLRMLVFREKGTGKDHPKEHLAIVKGEVRGGREVLTRVHSECLTSEIFGSLKCDCGEQLDLALDQICEAERGVLIYLRQEGRGIGLGNKIRAYALQAHGADTFDANRALGFPDDLRRYDVAACILKQLGIGSVALITNNPLKISQLQAEGIEVPRRVPSRATTNPHNIGYLRAKRERTGHLIELMTGDEPLPG